MWILIPYILNWLISFISNRKQRVVVDNIITEYINITRGVPQGTVLGPMLFSLTINDIKPVSPSSLLVKFADDITVSIPVRAEDSNIAESEVSSIMQWAEKNQMTLKRKSRGVVERSETFGRCSVISRKRY